MRQRTPAELADDIAAALRLLRSSWSDMLPTLRVGHGERVKGSREAPPPAPIAVVSLRREVAECLGSWARLVAEERDLRTGLDAADVPAVAGFLLVHADWLGGHEAGADAAAELSRYARQCEDVARERRTHVVPVGTNGREAPCVEQVWSDQAQAAVPCPGVLTARYREDDDLLPPVVRCSVDPSHSWAPHEWTTLGRRIEGAA